MAKKCDLMEPIVLSATLFVRGNTSESLKRACDSSAARQLGVRLVKWLEDGDLHPSWSLSISSGKIRIHLGTLVDNVESYIYNDDPVVRLNFEDGSYVELSGFHDPQHGEADKWLNACKHAVACAICNKAFQPIRDEEDKVCRISEQSLCRVISKLGTLVSTEDDPFLNQAKFLLKSRQALTEILTRLLNGGIDFISFKELDYLYKVTKKRRDPYLERDTDITLLEKLRSAASKLRISRDSSMPYMDAMKQIDSIVASLQQYPIRELDEDGDSSCSSSEACAQEKDDKDEFVGCDSEENEVEVELESGQGVFVEAASVTICHAFPSGQNSQTLEEAKDSGRVNQEVELKERKGKVQKMLPVANTTPTKASTSSTIVATPVGQRGRDKGKKKAVVHVVRETESSVPIDKDKDTDKDTDKDKDNYKDKGGASFVWVCVRQACVTLTMAALLVLAALSSPTQRHIYLSIERPVPSVERLVGYKSAPIVSIRPPTLNVKYTTLRKTPPPQWMHLIERVCRKVHQAAVFARREQQRKSQALPRALLRHAILVLEEYTE